MTSGNTRAAVLHGPGDLRVESRDRTCPGTGQVLIEVSHCGICGTDLHMVLDGWGQPGSVGGHEWSGRVVAMGDGVTGLVVGDAVVGGPSPACGTCAGCRTGRPSLCLDRATPGTAPSDGAFASHVLARPGSVVAVPDGLNLRTAALAEPLAVALHAVTVSGVRPGQRALVSGVGPIGALAIAALAARGITDIIAVEPNLARRELAATLGAKAIEPEGLEVPSIAEPRRIVDGAVDVALECSGKASAAEASLAQLGVTGTLVLVGTGLEPPRFDPNRILLCELVITGAFEYDAGGIDEALELLASGALDTDALIAPDEVGLDGLADAIDALAAGSLAGKVLVTPSRPEEP